MQCSYVKYSQWVALLYFINFTYGSFQPGQKRPLLSEDCMKEMPQPVVLTTTYVPSLSQCQKEMI